MTDVNWWLTAVAFALGVVLTTALMIRPVTGDAAAGSADESDENGT